MNDSRRRLAVFNTADRRQVESKAVPTATHPLLSFVRASVLHVGAAAAAASLRHDLVRDHRLEARDIDAAYAVSRVTPGTNLLALYAQLGHRLGGWPLAVQAVAVGALLPASFAVVIAALYVYSISSLVAALMTGARAGGVAVFLGAAVRLLKPQLVGHPWIAVGLALLVLFVSWMFPISLFVVLVVAGCAGAMWLRPS